MNTKPLETLPCEASGSVETDNKLFPIFLKAESLAVLVIGGGVVAVEKVQALLKNSPRCRLTIVATVLSDQLKEVVKNFSYVTLIERRVEEHDLPGNDLVIAAVSNRETSREIRQWAKQHRILVNVADTPDLCDFYLGSIVQKGHLKIAISTNGQSPTLAKRLRELFTELIPDDINQTLSYLAVIRSRMTGSFTEKIKRLNEITRVLIESERTP